VSRNAGGLFESVRRLVQALAETGMDVRVLGTQDEFTAQDLAAWAPIQVSAFKPAWPEKFGYSPHFTEELARFRPDVTHTHGIWLYPSVATNRYSRRSGTPYVISAHGMLDPWAIRNSRWKKVIAHFLYEGAHLKGAGCLRALCEAEARAIRQVGLKNPIAIIPNGIDLPEGNAQGAGREAHGAGRLAPGAEREPLGAERKTLGAGRKVLLYLGRIHPKKGLVNLLKAWKLALNDQPSTNNSWVLAIAGWDQGGHEDELKRLATELGLGWEECRGARAAERTPPGAENLQPSTCNLQPATRNPQPSTFNLQPSTVLFLGPQFGEAKTACYRDCDAFILPSLSEGVPMVVLEAWAWRKPVLMTPECNLPEGFAANAAIRVDPSVESIAAGLTRLFELPDSDLRAMGSAGFQLTAARYVWPRVAQDMKELYEWMLGGGQKPPCLVDF
jgi:poly(glycerol-phosphate) alpha-glucosyltransferase